ncbi:MAG: DUF3822 family protein [Bacteroidota bacterium]
MQQQIHINHTSFGQLSDLADSLVIEVSSSLLSFSELQSAENKPLFICHYPLDNTINYSLSEHLISAVKHFQFSRKKYEHVYINYFTHQFTLCPTAFYNNEHNRAMLEFNNGSISNQLIFTDDINADIKLIYAVDEALKSTLDQLFPHHQLKHSLTVLSKLTLLSEELSKEQIVLAVSANHIEVVVKQDHNLLLANQFSTKTQEDVLYYALFIIEQYQLNPLTANITITGNVDSNSEMILSLKKYIKNVHLASGNKSINWSNLTGAPQHFNYTLINRLFCE